jgi:cobalt-zinc-cadmium efflux system membrane fusion protein
MDYLLAEAEYSRVQRLFEHQAIAEKRLAETRLHYQTRKASYDRIAQQVDFSTEEDAEGDMPTPHFHIEAPIDGFVEEIHVHLGQSVRAGEKLFTLTNPDRVWLKAKVPLTVYSRIEQVRDASFSVEGYEGSFQVSQLNGRLISIGSAVDPITRTVPVLFEVDNPKRQLKINLFAEVALYTGDAVDGLAVPSEALIDSDGTPVLYVQVEGEAFVERSVQTGIVDGGYTQITSGLEAGEHVVVVGAYQVRLASLSTSVPTGHGHAH